MTSPVDPDFTAIAARVLDAPQGCGDHSCVVARPRGMGTNGGCRCERPTLRHAATQARALRADVRELLGVLGQDHLLDTATASDRVARARAGLEPKLTSRWTPRHVFTLHRVPDHLERVMVVRRRVLADDDIGLVVETPTGTLHVDLAELAEHGSAHGWGDHRWAPGPAPIVGMFWGCDLTIEIYDHLPTPAERADWLARRRRVQALAQRNPVMVWVSFEGSEEPLRRRACRLLGACVGDLHRDDLQVELPAYRPIPPGESGVVEHVLKVDLYTLAVEGSVGVADHHPGVDGARRVWLRKPTAAQIARDARR